MGPALDVRGSLGVMCFFSTEDFGLGMITNWGAHHVDIAQWGIGMELGGPSAVDARATFMTNATCGLLWQNRGNSCARPTMKSEKRASVVRRIEEAGVVAVIRLTDPRRLQGVMRALAEGGVRVFEVTMTVPNAIELIREVAASLPPDWLVGAGTVTDASTAQRAICAGAQFVVGPVFRPAVIAACHVYEVPAMPGCFTPTEILSAWETGADVVKVFPATSLGPQFIRDIRAPLPQLKLMPTGGVALDNAGEWLAAGAVAVGVGSALVDAAAVAAEDFGTLTANARRVVASVAKARVPA